jgi:hypothetical protein
LRVDNGASIERPDRQRDPERPDQEAHAERRAAGGDGEADAGIAQPPHRAQGAIGQGLVFGQ